MYNWVENIKIDVYEQGKLVDTTQFKNQITNVGLNWIADSLRVSTQDNEIKYLAWGASSSTAKTTNTALTTETGRKLITSQTSSGTGVCETVCYISPTEGVGTIKELGWFCGSSASATAGTGRLISRVIYERVKTNLESITVTRTDTFTT